MSERTDYLMLLQEREIRDARDDFYSFCCLREPEFYVDRPHLERLCNTLQLFYEKKLLKDDNTSYLKLMLRLPSQHGKTRTLVNFTMWVFGKNMEERIITASHTDSQATDIARYTRDGIAETKNIATQIVYSDIFPETKIKYGSASVQKWALKGQHFSYLGVGVGGAVTGKGATIRIIDDLIKDTETALSDTALSKIWMWLISTFSDRSAAKGGNVMEIYCATLWCEDDPQAKLERTEPGEWYILSMPAYDADTDKMLCDDMLNKESYLKLKHRMSADSRTKMIFQAKYHCVAISDSETKVFPVSSLKRYKNFPPSEKDENGELIKNWWTVAFVDTADEGKDYFSMPIARVYENSVYVFDAIFDQENLTIQEGQVQSKVKEDRINDMCIETNSFGAYFTRRIRELIPEIEIFGQYSKANKMARILANTGLVKLYFYFPENPNPTLERFMTQVYRLMKTSTKENDAPDALTGLAAYLEKYHGLFKE